MAMTVSGRRAHTEWACVTLIASSRGTAAEQAGCEDCMFSLDDLYFCTYRSGVVRLCRCVERRVDIL
jgi:hypothetical protein